MTQKGGARQRDSLKKKEGKSSNGVHQIGKENSPTKENTNNDRPRNVPPTKKKREYFT